MKSFIVKTHNDYLLLDVFIVSSQKFYLINMFSVIFLVIRAGSSN